METLKEILRKIAKELQDAQNIREKSYAEMRKVTSWSKQAILFMHQKRLDEAEEKISAAKQVLSKLWRVSKTHPNIIYGGMFSAAQQEYAEANIIFGLLKKSRLVTPEEIKVTPVDYVLGLADVIGEYRRLTLDALREGRIKEADSYLRMMDETYTELMALDESYMLVQGLRRKCDVMRKVIEATRGDLTQEIRRDMLEKHLKRLEQIIKTKKPPS